MVTNVLNMLNSIFFCLDIRQLQMIFTSQTILDVSFSVIMSFIQDIITEKETFNIFKTREFSSIYI